MTDLNLKPLLFFTICLILSLPSNLLGQSGGIFNKRGKASNEGGHGECVNIGDTVGFSIETLLNVDEAPCDLHLGATFPNGETQFSEIQSERITITIKEEILVDIYYADFELIYTSEMCENGLTVTLDLYCKDIDGNYSSIVPCETDAFDALLNPDLDGECSLATEYSVGLICCPDDTRPESDLTNGRNSFSIATNYDGTIYTMDGKIVHTFSANERSNIALEVEKLNVRSGIYIVSLRNGSTITSKKYFKN